MNGQELIVRVYCTPEGKCPFDDWLGSLKDPTARHRVDARIARLRSGNPGDAKSLGGGLHELRLVMGPGYRISYGLDGPRPVILLCGGDKRRQSADIARARALWNAYREEERNANG